MREPLYNQRFDDIYFSPEDGLAETRHVFLSGNNLPDAWQGRDHFIIVETGFGTGLNFLAVAGAFKQNAAVGQILDFVSFEKYPLDSDTIREALSPWQDEIGEDLVRMLEVYPLRINGFHRIQFSKHIRLTLIFDDINNAMPQLCIPRGVDAWFLDGFAPSKNPDMWGDALFDGIKRLSASDSSISTFTAAGFVKRAIADAGFEVTKISGFGRKREMITARKSGDTAIVPRIPKTVAIIGGGLAGTSAAYALRQCGIAAVIYEASNSLATGASGNMAGLYNPRFTAHRQPEADYFSSAFALAYRQFAHLQNDRDIGFNPCGVLQLMNSPEKEKRYRAFCENQGWHEDHVKEINAQDASDVAGVELSDGALFLPQSGAVNPAALCAAYADDVETVFGVNAVPLYTGGSWIVDGRAFDAVILACGAATRLLCDLHWLPINTVRGQITVATVEAQIPHTGICYGGYALPLGEQHIICGATFQKWRHDTDISPEDDDENLEKLYEVQPALKGKIGVVDHRAGLRVATQDHWPLVGAVPDYKSWISGKDDFIEGLYISAGHGSHGILSSLMAAYMIADDMNNAPLSVGIDSQKSLNAARFLARMRRKNQL